MGRLFGKRSDVMGAAMTPRVHADVIKAWADGAQVQYRTSNHSEWTDWDLVTADTPSFSTCWQWRVKTAPVKLMYRVALLNAGSGYRFVATDTHERAAELFGHDDFIRWASEWEMVEA